MCFKLHIWNLFSLCKLENEKQSVATLRNEASQWDFWLWQNSAKAVASSSSFIYAPILSSVSNLQLHIKQQRWMLCTVTACLWSWICRWTDGSVYVGWAGLSNWGHLCICYHLNGLLVDPSWTCWNNCWHGSTPWCLILYEPPYGIFIYHKQHSKNHYFQYSVGKSNSKVRQRLQ